MTAAADTPNPASGPTVVARLEAGAADAARALLDRLAEVFDASEAVVSAYDTGGGWTVAIHFNDPPNETAVRALVGLAAGPEAANALVFETLAAKDWVKASQEGLKPVEAGRFIVHSEHYRAQRPRPTASASRSGPRSPSAPDITARRGDACWRSTIFSRRDVPGASSTSAPAPACWRSPRPGCCAVRCWQATSTARAAGVARENVRRNRARSVTVIHAAGLGMRQFRERAPFDLVLANILLGPLQRLATPMARLLAPGARVVLSGLLTSQASAALAAYRRRKASRSNAASCSRLVDAGIAARPHYRLRRMFEAKFQTFDDAADPAASAPRVAALRTELARRGLDRLRRAACRLPPERISAAVGGAARLAHRLHRLGRRRDRADGARGAVRRRPLHVAGARAGRHVAVRDRASGRNAARPVDRAHARQGRRARLRSVAAHRRRRGEARRAPAPMPARRWSPIEPNPIDEIVDGPPCPAARRRSTLHDIRFAGEAAETKLATIRPEIAKLKADALVVSDPHAVAWTFNIRGADVVAHAAAALVRHRPARGPSVAVHRRPQAFERRARIGWRSSPTCARPSDFAGDARPRSAKPARPFASTRRPPPTRWRGSDHERRRQGQQGPRSDRAAQGGEECGRDRRRARSAPARRRGDGALPRLVRP